ncbi:unnamed protein product [Schistosoma margrebowiei]|uniref:Uncharacterized protein n=2 Tax=Schistosoma margrebowiei TaxID=48269 RepID=A0A183L9C8_9TREM|nr:unnamed protein product [Schistosoma margrebowiei]
MWETGKTNQIATEMRRYNLAVLGISKTHWIQAGQKRLATGEMLLYSGHEEDNAPHTQGVALMLSKVARNALMLVGGSQQETLDPGFVLLGTRQQGVPVILRELVLPGGFDLVSSSFTESHRSRIIKAFFKTKKEGISMNIIQCYTPTNDYNEDAKDQFYDRLQSIVKKCSTKDLNILMEDLDVTVVRSPMMEDLDVTVTMDNIGYENIIGRHGLGERNENGKRFANLCAFNKLVIGGTIFPHKLIHKTT